VPGPVEPRSGLISAVLRTRAVLDGDVYVSQARSMDVDGTSRRLVSAVERTEPDDPSKGHSLLIVEMALAGKRHVPGSFTLNGRRRFRRGSSLPTGDARTTPLLGDQLTTRLAGGHHHV